MMACAAPFVVFGLLYVLVVQPERVAASDAHRQLEIARAELNRLRAPARSGDDAHQSARDTVAALTAALSDPSVGRVANVAISNDRRHAEGTPITVTFDARYEQVGRFLWNVRGVPAAVDLQSVEIAPQAESRAGLLHARMTFLLADRGAGTPARASVPAAANTGIPPEWSRDPFASHVRTAAAPARVGSVVTSILFSEGRRVARVDGRIVAQGDRLGEGVVQSIEPEAVVIVEPDGRTHRLQIARPLIGAVPR